MKIYECDLGNLGLSFHGSRREAQAHLAAMKREHLTKDDAPFGPDTITPFHFATKKEALVWMNAHFGHGVRQACDQ